MKNEVSMREPARHHFGELLGQFWLHFGPIWVPKSSQAHPKRLKSAPRGDSKCFLAVSGGLLGRSWVPLGRFGTLRTLLGFKVLPTGASRSMLASRPPQFDPYNFKNHPQSPNHSKPSPGLQRPVEAARGGPAAGGVCH